MRRNTIGAVVVSLVLAAGSLVAQRAPASNGDVEVMLEAAKHTEQVEGRLKDAIERYRVIATRAAAMTPARKDVAATALLQMARSQEKLGQPEARATYQRIVREYPDQVAAVAAARARVGRPQTEITPRRVLDSTYVRVMDVSADGRLAVGQERTGFNAYNLMLRNVGTGQSRVLVPGSPEGSAVRARVSDDGQRVAYDWFLGDKADSIRVIDTTPGTSPVTIAQAPPDSVLNPLDWSPDGRQILAGLTRFRNGQRTSSELMLVEVGTRLMRSIRTFDSTPGFDAQFSPDGNYVAYSMSPRAGSTDRYIYALDLSTGRETAVVAVAGVNGLPHWAPDSRTLVFSSLSGGLSALHAVRVENGHGVGEPWVVRSSLEGTPLGFTRTGEFHYQVSIGGGVGTNYLYVLPRNPSPGDQPLLISGLSGTFSTDGSQLAFMRGVDLIVRNLSSGEERSFKRAGISVNAPVWLHDGSGLIVLARDTVDGRQSLNFHLLDLRTGSFRHLFPRDANGRLRTGVGTLSRDNTTMYLGARLTAGAPVTAIVGVNLTTGEERDILAVPGGVAQTPGIAVSPDGGTLAVFGESGDYEARIFTVGIDGSGYREVASAVPTSWLPDNIRWTPDGRSIVFVALDANRNWRVMRVSADGGPIEFDGLSFDTLSPLLTSLKLFPGNFNNIDLHPDGTQIVASTLTMSQHELWTLDNLMWVLNQR